MYQDDSLLEDLDEVLFVYEYSNPDRYLRIHSTDYAVVENTPHTVYVEAWLVDAYESADLYYTSTFTQISFDVNVIDICQSASIIQNNANVRQGAEIDGEATVSEV